MLLTNQPPPSFAMAVNPQEIYMKVQEDIHRTQLQFNHDTKGIHDMLLDITRERDNALTVLALSCGISQDASNQGKVILDEGVFQSIIKTVKGKKFISCCLSVLSPEHRWCIFPSLLTMILQVIDTPSTGTNDSVHWTVAQEREVEVKILASYVEVCLFTYVYLSLLNFVTHICYI